MLGQKRFIFHLSKLFVVSTVVVLMALVIFAADDTGEILKVIKGSNEPVRIIGIKTIRPSQSDLLIEIENLTAKPIRFVSYTVAPADYPRSDHPVAFGIGYGDWSAVSNSQKPVDLPIPGYRKKEIRFPSNIYEAFLQYQQSHDCLPHQCPEITLDKVAFCDGTGWEGFADGQDHSEWNGRDWKPSGRSNCGESK